MKMHNHCIIAAFVCIFICLCLHSTQVMLQLGHVPRGLDIFAAVTLYSLHMQPAAAVHVSATPYLLLPWLLPLGVTQSVTPTFSPDTFIQNIMNSNMTSEEKFKAWLFYQHRRYCLMERTCNNLVVTTDCHYCAPCQCDKECLRYGDCCPDLLLQDVQVVQPHKVEWACKENLFSGYTPEQRSSRLANATSYLVMDFCPPSAPPQLARDCMNSSLYHPVSALNKGNKYAATVYANIFCAACNEISAPEMVMWRVLALCPKSKNYSLSSGTTEMARLFSNDPDCFLIYYPPPTMPAPRQCYYNNDMVSECNVTGLWPKYDAFVHRTCGAYLDPKEAEGQVFQNVFCYICNSAKPVLFRRCLRGSVLSPMPFSALIDFSDAIYGAKIDPSALCSSGEVYDHEKGKCRTIQCSFGRHYMDGNCTAIFASAKDFGYSIYFAADLQVDLNLYDKNDLLHSFPAALEAFLKSDKKMMSLNVRFTEFVVSFDTTDANHRCSQTSRFFTVYGTLAVIEQVPQDSFERFLLSLRNTTISLLLSNTVRVNFTTRIEESVWMTQYYRSKTTSGGACVVTISLQYVKFSVDDDRRYERVSDLLTLPQIALEDDEFHVNTPTLGLVVPWLDAEIPLDRYQTFEEGSVRILLNDFLPKEAAYQARSSKRAPERAEVVLSVVCTSLSLAGLAATFMTYVLFKNLRTAPGKNNMNLAITLFLAQLLYLVGSGQTEIPGVCQVIGILIHYFWITAFSAMTVCSFHMWRAFTSMQAADSHDSAERYKQLLQYAVFIWGTAAAVVVLTLLAHIVATGGASIGYGGNYCYLSTALGVGVAVGVPVAVMVTANVTFFILTIRAIGASPKLQKSRDDEQHVWVYIKLSTLTGISWSLAFITFSTEVTALRYVFTIVNALQGIFICISFVFNRRVMALYGACCMHHKALPSGTMTSSLSRSTTLKMSSTATLTKSEASLSDVYVLNK